MCGSPVRRGSSAAALGSAVGMSRKAGGRRRQGFASASVALHESVMSAPQAPVSAKVCCWCPHWLHATGSGQGHSACAGWTKTGQDKL